MRNAMLQPAAPRRGMSKMGVIFLLAMVAMFIVLSQMKDKQKQEAEQKFQLQLTDPRIMLDRYFLERTRTRVFKDGDWKILLDFMSEDDLQWLEENKAVLASYGMRLPGLAAMAANENEQRFAALEYLIRFGPDAPRPVVVTAEAHGEKGIAYIHNPNDPKSIQPVFLIQEGGSWRIRRFMGTRDSPAIISRLTDAKSTARYNDDERAYEKDPGAYETNKRNALLAEVGITPQGTAAGALPNATPLPATASGSAPLMPGSLQRQTPVPTPYTPPAPPAGGDDGGGGDEGGAYPPDPTPLVPADPTPLI